MGNTNSRSGDHTAASHRQTDDGLPISPTTSTSRRDQGSTRARNRMSRAAELNLFGLGSSGSSVAQSEPAPFEHRETRAEREARRLERERAARLKERERSISEETIDGGYLVTLGTYTGPEDFSKPTVRQLQIERRIAPFWRGLNDYSPSYTDSQLIALARGLPLPEPDAPLPPDLLHAESPSASTQNLNNLTVPLGPRTMSVASDRSGSITGSAVYPSSPISTTAPRTSSPFKPRAKALAAALSSVGSRNSSQTDMTPREINLPPEPFVNGKPLELVLYRDGIECPICFIYYPPYLNHTRCCDQPICSECFVQIKRPDPHLPEHHGENAPTDSSPPTSTNPAQEDQPDILVSEPATCPYCQQPEFGVTYEPPPFRRGLVYSIPPVPLPGTAMSSQSSLNSTLTPPSFSPGGRRRTKSLSANAPNVITTDRVRPDWATKLASQRAHQARRAAAATALHTAAFLMGGSDTRSFIFPRPGRLSRRGTTTPGGSSNQASDGPAGGPVDPTDQSVRLPPSQHLAGQLLARRSRMEELEDMMLMEAMRLSLASEEERKRKAEKEAKKEAKKKEKEDRKSQKQQRRQSEIYPSTPASSSSSLSLGRNRHRGNSTASSLRVEAAILSADSSSTQEVDPSIPQDKGKAVDRGIDASTSSSQQPLAVPQASGHPRGPSHLRQMSSASSVTSSVAGSPTGSDSGRGKTNAANPHGSSTSLAGHSEDGDPGGAGSEPMFNFRSLAEVVGVDVDRGQALPLVLKSEGTELDVGGQTAIATEPSEDGEMDTTSDSIATLLPSQSMKSASQQIETASHEPVDDGIGASPTTANGEVSGRVV